MQEIPAKELIVSGNMKLGGKAELMTAMFGALDPVDPQFNIVIP